MNGWDPEHGERRGRARTTGWPRLTQDASLQSSKTSRLPSRPGSTGVSGVAIEDFTRRQPLHEITVPRRAPACRMDVAGKVVIERESEQDLCFEHLVEDFAPRVRNQVGVQRSIAFAV